LLVAERAANISQRSQWPKNRRLRIARRLHDGQAVASSLLAEPVMVVSRSAPEEIRGQGMDVTALAKKVDDMSEMVKGLNNAAQEHTIKTAIAEANPILVMPHKRIQGLHGGSPRGKS